MEDKQTEQKPEPEEWLDSTSTGSPDEPPFTPDDPERVDQVVYSPTEGAEPEPEAVEAQKEADKAAYGTMTDDQIKAFDIAARQRFEAEIRQRNSEIKAGSPEAEEAVREAIQGR